MVSPHNNGIPAHEQVKNYDYQSLSLLLKALSMDLDFLFRKKNSNRKQRLIHLVDFHIK